MTVECAFDIGASKFRIVQKSIETKIENADHIVKAICILHNVIINLEKNQMDLKTIETENEISSTNYLGSIRGGRLTNRTSQSVLELRNRFVQYFKHNKKKFQTIFTL
uniref:DDE Tnp4 domain-containing protein n=1 Tax=Sipha flava TaxID=143950 RepID=A0A2S2QGI3_9HEMI